MQRQTVYAGQEVLETDALNIQRGIYIGFGKGIESLFGSATVIHHMPCVPGTGLAVEVGPGELYETQADDATAWSSLAANSLTLQKQGLCLSAASLATPAPTVSGQSIVYLIEGQVQQVDGGPTVLPYYNSADPSVPLLGPEGSSQSSFTNRNDALGLQVKAGTAATTGSQVAPSPDAGWTPLWAVTVAYGATSIVQADIAVASGAPFIALNLGTLGQVLTVSAGLNIASVHVGKVLNCVAALTLSLPAAAGVPNGFGFGFVATGGTVTLAPAGTDTINGANADWLLQEGNTAYVTRTDLGEWAITATSVYTGSQYTLIGSVALPGESAVTFTSIPAIYADLYLEFVGSSASSSSIALSIGHSINNGGGYASGVIGDHGDVPIDFVIEMHGYTQAVGGAQVGSTSLGGIVGSGSDSNTGGTGGVSSTTLTLTAVQVGWVSVVGDEVWYSGMATPSIVTAIPGGGTTGAYGIAPAADIPGSSTVYMRHTTNVGETIAGGVTVSPARLEQKHASPVNAIKLSLASGTWETGTLFLYGR